MSGIVAKFKRSEKVLAESQQSHDTLLSNLNGMAYRCLNDRDWTMKFVSEGCVELTGYQPSDLVENSKVSYAKLMHPEDQDHIWNVVQTAIKGKTSYKIIYRINTASGEQKWVWEQGCGVFSPDGDLLFLEGFIIDITTQKRASEKLEASELFLNNVFKSIQEGISILNTDLTIRHVNEVVKRWFAGNLPLEGKKCYECYHNKKEPCYPCPTLRCIHSGKIEHEIVQGLSSLDVEWLEIFSYPVKDAELGKITGVIEFVRDITERKQAEIALCESEEKFRNLAEQLPNIIYSAYP